MTRSLLGVFNLHFIHLSLLNFILSLQLLKIIIHTHNHVIFILPEKGKEYFKRPPYLVEARVGMVSCCVIIN